MNPHRPPTRHLLVTLLLSVLVFTSFTEPGHSQIGIGVGGGRNNDGISIDPFQAFKTVKSLTEIKGEVTYEQEHYLGRAISANILNQYTVYNDSAANRYVALIGQTVAAHSDLPQTFGGYRFILLDSDEINALAAPGGIIFITRGMLRACKSEDQLAAVLAHEVAHVQNRHGFEIIKAARWKKFGANVALLAAAGTGGAGVAVGVDLLGDMAGDFVKQALTKGYGKKLEKQADIDALAILMRMGYEPHESAVLMQNMQERFVKGKKDFSKTHPKPKDRVKTIDKALRGEPDAEPVPQVRLARFDAALIRARAE